MFSQGGAGDAAERRRALVRHKTKVEIRSLREIHETGVVSRSGEPGGPPKKPFRSPLGPTFGRAHVVWD